MGPGPSGPWSGVEGGKQDLNGTLYTHTPARVSSLWSLWCVVSPKLHNKFTRGQCISAMLHFVSYNSVS